MINNFSLYTKKVITWEPECLLACKNKHKKMNLKIRNKANLNNIFLSFISENFFYSLYCKEVH